MKKRFTARLKLLLYFKGIFHLLRFEINLKNPEIEDFWNNLGAKFQENFGSWYTLTFCTRGASDLTKPVTLEYF